MVSAPSKAKQVNEGGMLPPFNGRAMSPADNHGGPVGPFER
jgi:hypothetical protein